EAPPEEITGAGDRVDGAQPPSQTLRGDRLPQGETEEAGDDNVDDDGGGNVAVLRAHQVGGDQLGPARGVRRLARTVHRRLSVPTPHAVMLSVCLETDTEKKKGPSGCPPGPSFSRPPSYSDSARRCFKKATGKSNGHKFVVEASAQNAT